MKFEKRVKGLYEIEHDMHSWSWLLDPNKPIVPPFTLRDKSSARGATRLTFAISRRRTGEDEALLEKEEK